MIIPEMDERINELTVKMAKLADEFGNLHPDTIAVSQELDGLIIAYQKLKHPKVLRKVCRT